MADADLSTREWQNFRKAYIATVPPICSLCGQTVDTTLPGTHPQGPTIDHRIPRSKGGALYDPTNCALAHQACNARKRNDHTPTRNSRAW